MRQFRSTLHSATLRAALLILACALVATLADAALAVGWNDYRLGEFYDTEDATPAEVRAAGRAVVFFGNATGFVVSEDGYILTNHHVYQSFGRSGVVYLEWTRQGYRQRLAVSLVTADRTYDMALYKANARGLPFIPLRTASPRIGEDVFCVGHPNGRAQEVSFGRILATGLVIAGRPSVEYSAQTWWGSSGSPICDRQGRALALHWGWDANGQSNGRLTGVPIDLMARAVSEIATLARRTQGGTSAATAPSSATQPAPSSASAARGSPSGTVKALALGQAARDALNQPGDYHVYWLDVRARGDLTVELTGPAGADLDIFLWKWSATSQRSTEVGRSDGGGSREQITLRATPGAHAVVVYSASGAGAYRLEAGLDQQTSVAGTTASAVSGFLRGASDWELYRFDAQTWSNVAVYLDGPAGADFDVYVFEGGLVDPDKVVAAGEGPDADEAIAFSARPGTYAILVQSYRGAGSFDVRVAP